MEAVVVHVGRLQAAHVHGYSKLCSEIWNTHSKSNSVQSSGKSRSALAEDFRQSGPDRG